MKYQMLNKEFNIFSDLQHAKIWNKIGHRPDSVENVTPVTDLVDLEGNFSFKA